ncbi:hypothetical protein [Pseudomonas sp. S1(2024)]|uniref:hypothetical protein n=1 Tax=Pseudomonas sp. S1(2024) TaxID=3390191 RepID=UPI00397C522A
MKHIQEFLAAIKNAGVVISGEEVLQEMMVRSDHPLVVMLQVAEQGRPQSMGFYQCQRGANPEQIWRAMQVFDRRVQRELFLMFMLSVSPTSRSEYMPCSTEC